MDQMRPGLNNVLQCLSLNGYSVFSLIDDILAPSHYEDERIKLFREGIEREAADICARLLCFDSGPQKVLKFGRVQFKIHRYTVPIDMLPDNVLLEIFDFCLCEPTRFPIQHTTKWRALVQVCLRWRQIIFASPHRLDLHLSCTYGTPVRQNLIFWPVTLPLTIDYPAFFFFSHRVPGAVDEDNIVAALEHPDRVHRITICAVDSLLSKVATVMEKSFPALTDLDLEWEQPDVHSSRGLPITGRLLGGSAPRLRHLHLRHISISQFTTFLLSAPNLVNLKLEDLFLNDFISPEAIVMCLAVLTGLTALSITFSEFDDDMSPSDQTKRQLELPVRATLPSLTSFHYRGYSEYMEDFLVQINAPQLDYLRLDYYAMHEIQAPQLSRFIDRTENLKLNQFRRAEVTFYPMAITSILDYSQGDCSEARIILDLLEYPDIYMQVPFVADMLGQLVPMFHNVDHLIVHGDNVEPGGMESTRA